MTDIIIQFFEQLEAKDKVISFLSEQIKEKDKEIERLHLLIERLTPSKVKNEGKCKIISLN
ncbi:MAG: hypothetical protein J5770_06645 [Bacteroidaceae bacterium]|nr:hypothetical protein [Bacteroidaceae bacterium]